MFFVQRKKTKTVLFKITGAILPENFMLKFGELTIISHDHKNIDKVKESSKDLPDDFFDDEEYFWGKVEISYYSFESIGRQIRNFMAVFINQLRVYTDKSLTINVDFLIVNRLYRIIGAKIHLSRTLIIERELERLEKSAYNKFVRENKQKQQNGL